MFSSVAQVAESGPGRAHPRCRQSAAAAGCRTRLLRRHPDQEANAHDQEDETDGPSAGCHPISLGSLIPRHARGLLSAMEAEEPEAFAAAEHLVDELPLRSRCGLAVHLRGANLGAQQIAVVELVPVTAHGPVPVKDDPSQSRGNVKADGFISISSPGRVLTSAG